MSGAADDGFFYAGQNAFASRKPRAACPINIPTRLRQDWLDGWAEAKRYADVRAMIEAACSGCERTGALIVVDGAMLEGRRQGPL